MSDNEKYGFPVYATQGGGLVREIDGNFFFVENPFIEGFGVGDKMPSGWTLIPANKLADEREENRCKGVFAEFLCDQGW